MCLFSSNIVVPQALVVVVCERVAWLGGADRAGVATLVHSRHAFPRAGGGVVERACAGGVGVGRNGAFGDAAEAGGPGDVLADVGERALLLIAPVARLRLRYGIVPEVAKRRKVLFPKSSSVIEKTFKVFSNIHYLLENILIRRYYTRPWYQWVLD